MVKSFVGGALCYVECVHLYPVEEDILAQFIFKRLVTAAKEVTIVEFSSNVCSAFGNRVQFINLVTRNENPHPELYYIYRPKVDRVKIREQYFLSSIHSAVDSYFAQRMWMQELRDNFVELSIVDMLRIFI